MLFLEELHQTFGLIRPRHALQIRLLVLGPVILQDALRGVVLPDAELVFLLIYPVLYLVSYSSYLTLIDLFCF